MLQTAQTNFQASSKDYLKVIEDLSVIQGQLATLKAEGFQLVYSSNLYLIQINNCCRTKSELFCLNASNCLFNFRTRSTSVFRLLDGGNTLLTDYQKLVAFLDAMDVIVTIAVEIQVDPFLDHISGVTSAPLTLGGYTITQFTSVVCTRH